jgi:hypothetical protein
MSSNDPPPLRLPRAAAFGSPWNDTWTWSKWLAVSLPRFSIRAQPLPLLICWRQIAYFVA